MSIQEESVICGIEHCNRPKNHDGPHGLDVGHGLILGPFGSTGKVRVLDTPESTDLRCDCCNALMVVTVRDDGGGGTLKCSSCQQSHSFSEDRSSSTVIARLYPSLKRGDSLWPEWLDYREKQVRFNYAARKLLGLSTDDEALKVFESKLAEERSFITEPQKETPWYIRLWNWGQWR